jgi:predicted amidohydrolase YtcJ
LREAITAYTAKAAAVNGDDHNQALLSAGARADFLFLE